MQSAEMRRLKDRNDERYGVAIEGMTRSAAGLRDTSFSIQESIMIPGYDELEAVNPHYQSAILRGFYTKRETHSFPPSAGLIYVNTQSLSS